VKSNRRFLRRAMRDVRMTAFQVGALLGVRMTELQVGVSRLSLKAGSYASVVGFGMGKSNRRFFRRALRGVRMTPLR
jgi:hypothetical protein